MAGKTKNSVRLEVCPTRLSGKHDNYYQKKKWAEIINTIDALYNSGGGTIILRYNKSPPHNHVRNCTRTLEQKILIFLGTITLTHDVQIIQIQPSASQAHGEMKIIVTTTTKTEHMAPVSYNMYLPSNQQVMEILPSEKTEKLRRFLMENIPAVKPIESGSHHRDFVQGDFVTFSESKITQFKNVKDKAAKKTTFTDRFVGKSNKFPCYVSAFANYAGGHMYAGIDDEGKVQGEHLDKSEKEKVKAEITKVIKKMIWPKKSEPADASKDQRWDVHFEPVKNSEKNVISSLYVVVVFIAQCRGGVFTKEPECYEIVDNRKVERVDFTAWKRTIDPRFAEEGTSCANTPWDLVYEELTHCLNSNCNGDELDAASKTAQENYKMITDVKITCLSKKVSFYLRKGKYDTAEEILREYSKILPECTDQKFPKVMKQYLNSIMERCKGDFEKSYEIANNCLNDLEKLPRSTMSASFYIQRGLLENILAIKTGNCELLTKAEKSYDIAKSHLDQLQRHSTTKAEYQQKIYINKALLFLGFCLAGDMLQDSERSIDIQKAQDYLSLTQEIVIRQGYPLSKFRKIQNLFAHACLSYRMANDEQSRRIELLKSAVNYSKEAERLARDLGFAEMMIYAKNFVAFFESKQSNSLQAECRNNNK